MSSDTPVTIEQLEEWKRLCEAATKGPWQGDNAVIYGFVKTTDGVVVCEMPSSVADMNFISAARTALPRAIAEIEAQNNEVTAAAHNMSVLIATQGRLEREIERLKNLVQ